MQNPADPVLLVLKGCRLLPLRPGGPPTFISLHRAFCVCGYWRTGLVLLLQFSRQIWEESPERHGSAGTLTVVPGEKQHRRQCQAASREAACASPAISQGNSNISSAVCLTDRHPRIRISQGRKGRLFKTRNEQIRDFKSMENFALEV